jgi:four helix bundle protein
MNKNRQTIKTFTDLTAWQEGHGLVILVYQITKQLPKEETYSLIDQMRRSAVPVTSNIAEGFGRQTYKEKLQFYYQAQGSLTELKNQILVAKDIGYLNENDFRRLVDQANDAHRLLQGLISSTKRFLNHKQ